MFDFKKAYLDAKRDKSALESALFQFGILPKNTSVKIGICPKNPNRYIFTDFGTPKNSAFQQGKGYDIEGLIKGFYPKNAAQQIQILTNLGFGSYPQTNNGATQNPNKGATVNPQIVQKKVQKKGVQPSKNLPTIPKILTWCDEISKDLLAYFDQKTGCGDVDFLTKHGIKPTRPQFCKHQYLAEANGLILVRKVEPKNENTARAYRAGDWSKFPETSYLFGSQMFPTSPKKTDVLILCEGQTDTICINYHFNTYGIYAVTVGSASTGYLSDADANNLKSLFSNIFVLWDNDKAGIEGSPKFADAHGFGWIDAKAFFGEGLKDICEAWGKAFDHFLTGNYPNPKERAQNLLLEQFKESTKKSTPKPTQYTIPAITGDKFSIEVKNAIRHDFNQYLSEPQSFEQFVKYTELYPRILLESPPGTGKSILIAKLFDELVTKTQKFERIVLFVPTIPLGEQLTGDAAFSHIDVLFICGKTAEKANEKLAHSKFCAITFDSSTHLPPSFFDNALLVVDESHQIGTDYDYRKSPMRAVWGVLGNPLQPTICLSGTAEYLYTTNLCAGYNFQLIKGFPKVANKINITGKLYNPFEVKRYELVTHIQKYRPKTGTTLLKINSKSSLEIWGKDFESKGLSNSIIYSNDNKGGIRRSLNPDYNSIIEKGTLHAHTDVLTTTCLLEAGVSLKFPIPLVCAIDTAFWAGNMQFSTRPRMYADTNTGKTVNNLVEFWIFFADAETETNPTKGESKTQLFKLHYQKAQQFCKELNNLPLDVRKDQLEKLRTSNTFKEKFIFEKDLNSIDYNSTFEVDVPAIEHFLIGLEIENSTPQQIIDRILARDNRYHFEGFKDVEATPNPKLTQLKNIAYAQKKAQKVAFFNLLGSNFTATLEAIALTADKKYKAELLNYLNVPYFRKEQIAQIQAFADTNKDAFEQSEKSKLACQIIECIKLGSTIVEGIEKVSKGKYDPNDFERISLKQLNTLAKTSPHLLTRKEKNTLSTHSAVSKVFDNLMYNQRKGRTKPQTLEQLTDKLNETLTPFINKLYTKNKALDFLKVFYVVEGEGNQKDKNGVRFWSYTLTEAHDLGRVEAKIIPTK
jgi:Type III restriction enzyme, res subunit